MILAVDLGTSTGFAYGRGDTVPAVGVLTMPSTGDDVGAFLKFFRDWFVPTIRRLQLEAAKGQDARITAALVRGDFPPAEEPLLVVFEAPILPQPKAEIKWIKGRPVAVVHVQTTIMTTRKLQSLAGVLELMCADLEVPCYEVHLNTAKKELTGHGHAEKGAMLMMARRAGLALSDGPEAYDEADAFAAWLVALRYHRKQYLPHWDRVLWGRR